MRHIVAFALVEWPVMALDTLTTHGHEYEGELEGGERNPRDQE